MMAKIEKVAILVVAALGAIMLQMTEAEDFTVGDSTGWINNPPGGASFYSNWAKNFTFKVNDTLVFNFPTGRHVVAILSQANFEKCNFTKPIQVLSTGPARVALNRSGEFYFACAFTGHCNSGQKLSVNVVSASTSTSPSPAPSPTASPPCQ
ncbi:blue copper protein-like [Neltuma alba]|uniref:blue copper protein-like n=1 Tax=Neltuma alba TaxID=207710 RepID=UPI0010A31BC4|nr:blue copper protein-like [Prosopis alba]XP_028801259.1 blue copper protein-like [Prosopis alba]